MKKKIKGKKRIKGILATLCLFIFFAAGCGESAAFDTTTIEFDKDGDIIQTIVEDFPKDFYDVEELRKMNQTEVDEYNQSVGEEAVEIINTEYDGNAVKIAMKYKNTDAYFALNKSSLFYGTVEQALSEGYDLDITLNNIKDNSLVTGSDLREMKDKHIVILDENVDIQTYGSILYVSDDVTCDKSKKLATVSGEGKSYIVFK